MPSRDSERCQRCGSTIDSFGFCRCEQGPERPAASERGSTTDPSAGGGQSSVRSAAGPAAATTERFVVERQPDGRWYATHEKNGEPRAGSGLHDTPLDALRWALPVEEPQSDA